MFGAEEKTIVVVQDDFGSKQSFGRNGGTELNDDKRNPVLPGHESSSVGEGVITGLASDV